MGSPNFMKPAYAKGTPVDWVVTQSVSQECDFKHALAKDEGKAAVNPQHPTLEPPRSTIESLVVYVGANAADPTIPMDGSHITSTVVGMLPPSRGTVTLASTDATAAPPIDTNYNATEADRYVLRSGLLKPIVMFCVQV